MVVVSASLSTECINRCDKGMYVIDSIFVSTFLVAVQQGMQLVTQHIRPFSSQKEVLGLQQHLHR